MCIFTVILIPSPIGSLSCSALNSLASLVLYSAIPRSMSASSKPSAHVRSQCVAGLLDLGAASSGPHLLINLLSCPPSTRGGVDSRFRWLMPDRNSLAWACPITAPRLMGIALTVEAHRLATGAPKRGCAGVVDLLVTSPASLMNSCCSVSSGMTPGMLAPISNPA